ncbi:MAG: hypothetical protein [Arizlama microvirus]|nr:MAG: hypothetical protein [Arizlama microvirus]
MLFFKKEFIVKRFNVNKGKSARKFRSNIKHTKAPNIHSAPQRGGWRL